MLNLCELAKHLCHSLRNQFQNKLAINMKNKHHMQLQKVCHKHWLICGHFQMARTKVMLSVGRRGLPSWGNPQTEHHPHLESLHEEKGSWSWRWWGDCQSPHSHDSWLGWWHRWNLCHQCLGDVLHQAYHRQEGPHKGFRKGGVKRLQRYQLRTVALCEICWYLRSTMLLIHKQPFVCLVHMITQVHGVHDLNFQVCTVQAL